MRPHSGQERQFSLLENAPRWVVYAPHVPYAFWLMARYRGFTLPAYTNPTIPNGGIVGESKTDLFALVGSHARLFFAPSITVLAATPAADVAAQLAAAGLTFPLVAKPDIGRNGRGVKRVNTSEELSVHQSRFPASTKLMLQPYIPASEEAGVFYVRFPDEAHGRITSLTLKHFPTVVGDGTHTLRELILRDPRAQHLAPLYFRRNAHALDTVLSAGEQRALVSVGNHVRGALFENGAAFITPELTRTFDAIAHDIDGFYFGRFDVRYKDRAAFMRGEDFTIIEFNGASSEPTHVWDRRTSVRATYRALLGHWRMAFALGAQQRARGARGASMREILREYRKEVALLTHYPDEE